MEKLGPRDVKELLKTLPQAVVPSQPREVPWEAQALWVELLPFGACAAPASSQTGNESPASHRTSPSGHARRLFCALGRAGPRGSRQRQWPHRNGPWELARPGDPRQRRHDASVSKQHGLAKLAGFSPSQKPVGFSPSMWGSSLCKAEATPGQGPSLPRCLSPWGRGSAAAAAPSPAPCSPHHCVPILTGAPPCRLPCPPTGNDLDRSQQSVLSWTGSLGIFGASSLLYVSHPFHSRHFFFLTGKMEKGKQELNILSPPSAIPVVV